MNNQNILHLINECSSHDNWKLCLSDIKELSCKDIFDLIKLKVDTGKETGSYETDKKNIIKLFNNIKNDSSNMINNTHNIINNTINNLNCAIKELNNQYELKENEKLEELDNLDAKIKYIHQLINENDNKDKINKLSSTNNNNTDENHTLKKYLNISLIVIIVLLLIIFITVLLYKKPGKTNSFDYNNDIF
jgi:hypothetical protein